MSERSSRSFNIERDHVAAIGGEVARQVINQELAVGMPVGTSANIDARIGYNEQLAADGYMANPSGSNEGLNEAYKFGENLKTFLESNVTSFSSQHGVVELDKAKGITPAVKNSIEKAMEAARQLMVGDLTKPYVNTHLSTPIERKIEGTSLIDIDTASEKTILAFDMMTPDGHAAKHAIFELFGVDQTVMDASLPSAQGISHNDQGYGIVHRDQNTRIPGLVLEERLWISLPGADKQKFAQLYVKKAPELPDTIASLY